MIPPENIGMKYQLGTTMQAKESYLIGLSFQQVFQVASSSL